MTENGDTPDEELAGADAIVEVMTWIQTTTLGAPDKMEELFVTRGIDPQAFAEAGQIMVQVAVAMAQEPEAAVQAAFMTGGLMGAFLGRDHFTTDMLPEVD